MQPIIIAIDGFSSCGKSTLAKALAKQLNYSYIDTGAMYRAVSLYILRKGIDWASITESEMESLFRDRSSSLAQLSKQNTSLSL